MFMRYLDSETTGLSSKDEIVEITILNEDGTVLLDTLVRPVNHINWPEAERIHHISPAMVKDAPTYDEIKDQVKQHLKGHEVVIYNADYDSTYIKEELSESTVRCCMLKFAEDYGDWNEYHGSYTWQNLETAAEYVLHEWTGKKHRSLADTQATRSVWRYLTVPAEHNRIKSYYQNKKIDMEARKALRRIEWEEGKAERERIYQGEKIANEWIGRFLNNPNWPDLPTGKRHTGFLLEYTELCHRVFTGYIPQVWEEVYAFEEKGLPIFQKKNMVPDELSDSLTECRSPEGLEPAGLLISPRKVKTTTLYKKTDLLKQPYLWQKWSEVPECYVSISKLKKEYITTKAQRDQLKPVGRVERVTQYQAGTTELYDSAPFEKKVKRG